MEDGSRMGYSPCRLPGLYKCPARGSEHLTATRHISAQENATYNSRTRTAWILNHYAQEPGGPGGTRHYGLARHLKASGWNSFIIAAGTELNTGRQRLAADERFRLEHFDGVPFLWIRTPPYQGNGGGRLKNMLAYSLRSLLPRTTRSLPRPDVVIGSSVHPFAAAAGLLIARRFKVPFVFEVRDLWPQTLIDLGRISENGISARLMRRLELWLYRNAAKIVVLLPLAHEYITPLGIPRQRIAYIPNGVEMGVTPGPPKPSTHFTLMYFGAHGQANGLEPVLHAMKLLQDNSITGNVRLRLVGDGPSKLRLVSLATELALTNVSFEPPIAKDAIPTLAAEADAFIFNLIDAPVFRYGISSNKLFDFMAASRPTLFCCNAGNNPVAEAGAGMTVLPNDPHALSEAILELTSLASEDRARIGCAGRAFVEANHSYKSLAQRLALVLDEVVGCAQ